jgi:hypothetical protein
MLLEVMSCKVTTIEIVQLTKRNGIFRCVNTPVIFPNASVSQYCVLRIVTVTLERFF